MAINDILAELAVKIGLKKTDLQRCESSIAELEEQIRDLYDELERKLEEARQLEARIRKIKAQYDQAAPASKKLLESQLKSLMGDFRHLQELQDLTLRNIEKSKLLLQSRRMELEVLLHPVEVDAVEDAADAKQELLDDLKDEDRELAKLKDKAYVREEESEADRPTTPAYDQARKEALNREFESLFGKPVEPAQAGSASEPGAEIA